MHISAQPDVVFYSRFRHAKSRWLKFLNIWVTVDPLASSANEELKMRFPPVLSFQTRTSPPSD